jgi:3-methyladenine DNA glycosylase AlkD
MQPTPEAYYQLVKDTFRAQGDPAIAQGQMAYMRHKFEYFGLKMPAWTALAKDIIQQNGLPDTADLKALARLCFADEHREMHYFALEIVEKSLKKQAPDFIHFLEELICTQSWWDSVDWINKLVGAHFKKHPALILPTTERWMNSGNFWLQRVCLIFQLTYKDKTDFNLLGQYILRLSGSKEFFIQKAAGWALRQYSRTNPTAVAEFVAAHPHLAALTKREALRLM